MSRPLIPDAAPDISRRQLLQLAVATIAIPSAEYVRKFFPVGIDLRARRVTGQVLPQVFVSEGTYEFMIDVDLKTIRAQMNAAMDAAYVRFAKLNFDELL